MMKRRWGNGQEAGETDETASAVAVATKTIATEPDDAESAQIEMPATTDEPALPVEEVSAASVESRVKYKGTGFAWSWLGWLILVVALLPVIVQNTQIVQVRYVIWDIRVPLAAAIIAVAVIAEVATEIIGWAWRARRRRQLAMKAELKELKRQTGGNG